MRFDQHNIHNTTHDVELHYVMNATLAYMNLQFYNQSLMIDYYKFACKSKYKYLDAKNQKNFTFYIF